MVPARSHQLTGADVRTRRFMQCNHTVDLQRAKLPRHRSTFRRWLSLGLNRAPAHRLSWLPLLPDHCSLPVRLVSERGSSRRISWRAKTRQKYAAFCPPAPLWLSPTTPARARARHCVRPSAVGVSVVGAPRNGELTEGPGGLQFRAGQAAAVGASASSGHAARPCVSAYGGATLFTVRREVEHLVLGYEGKPGEGGVAFDSPDARAAR